MRRITWLIIGCVLVSFLTAGCGIAQPQPKKRRLEILNDASLKIRSDSIGMPGDVVLYIGAGVEGCTCVAYATIGDVPVDSPNADWSKEDPERVFDLYGSASGVPKIDVMAFSPGHAHIVATWQGIIAKEDVKVYGVIPLTPSATYGYSISAAANVGNPAQADIYLLLPSNKAPWYAAIPTLCAPGGLQGESGEFHEMVTAPDDGYEATDKIGFAQEDRYWLKTRDGRYAKIRIQQLGYIDGVLKGAFVALMWQPDGSPFMPY